MAKTETNDPWAAVDPPPTTQALSARRTDPDSRWPFFWGLDHQRRRLLMLQHSPDTPVPGSLPRFRGMTVARGRPGGGDPDFLFLQLRQPEYADVFQEFCSDLMRVTNRAETEPEAVSRFIGRAWAWHRFLSTGRSGRLSTLEQMGLLGELRVLGESLLPTLGAECAVSAWNGPLGSAQDFGVGTAAIEVKAIAAGRSKVRISSEHQLCTEFLDHLFLAVVPVARAYEDGDDTATVPAAAEALRDTLRDADPVIADDFERRLRATGFDWEDDYSDFRWRTGARRWFAVRPDFPRITPESLPHGLSAVHYTLALPAAADYAVPEDSVLPTLRHP